MMTHEGTEMVPPLFIIVDSDPLLEALSVTAHGATKGRAPS